MKPEWLREKRNRSERLNPLLWSRAEEMMRSTVIARACGAFKRKCSQGLGQVKPGSAKREEAKDVSMDSVAQGRVLKMWD